MNMCSLTSYYSHYGDIDAELQLFSANNANILNFLKVKTTQRIFNSVNFLNGKWTAFIKCFSILAYKEL